MFVHGAANSALVWKYWQPAVATRGWPVYAVDLRGHGGAGAANLARTSMSDYAADVRRVAQEFGQPPITVGWSMGGLVALMVAATGDAAACVALAPSTPARAVDPSVELRTGVFGAEEYGITSRDPDEPAGMPDLDREERRVALASLSRESRYARDERKAGIVIESLPCPLLIVTGTADRQWPRTRYDGLWLKADFEAIEGASHWGLVLNRRALDTAVPAVDAWLQRVLGKAGRIR